MKLSFLHPEQWTLTYNWSDYSEVLKQVSLSQFWAEILEGELFAVYETGAIEKHNLVRKFQDFSDSMLANLSWGLPVAAFDFIYSGEPKYSLSFTGEAVKPGKKEDEKAAEQEIPPLYFMNLKLTVPGCNETINIQVKPRLDSLINTAFVKFWKWYKMLLRSSEPPIKDTKFPNYSSP